MEVNYKRDLNHNYLILTADEIIDTESYQVRLLMTSAPPGFLRCTMQTADNRIQFYYDITSLHTVLELYEHKKMNLGDIQLLFGEIIRVLEEMEAYLMNCGSLLLKSEYIYLDPDIKQVSFCFFPAKSHDVAVMFRELAEYLLPKIDHTDQGAVMLGYSIYRKAMEDSIYLEQVKGELYREYLEAPGQNQEAPPVAVDKLDEQYFSEDPALYVFEEEKDSSQYPVVPTIGIVISGVVFFGYLYFLNRSVYSWKVYGAAAVILVILCAVPGIIYMIRTNGRKNKQTKKEQNNGGTVKKDIEENIEAKFWEQEEYPRKAEPPEDIGATVVLAPSPADKLPCLIGVHPSILQPIVINAEVLILGKLESAADVVLPSPAVSRIHAKIVKENGYSLYDLNSRNGTRVNQNPLAGNEGYELKDGDEITFGDLTYRFWLKV